MAPSTRLVLPDWGEGWESQTSPPVLAALGGGRQTPMTHFFRRGDGGLFACSLAKIGFLGHGLRTWPGFAGRATFGGHNSAATTHRTTQSSSSVLSPQTKPRNTAIPSAGLASFDAAAAPACCAGENAPAQCPPGTDWLEMEWKRELHVPGGRMRH